MKRASVLKSVLAGSACAMILATAAVAQTREFNVPAGDLKTALDAYVRQSGSQIVYRVDDVRGVRSPGVRGDLGSEAALLQLLSGSGFTVRRDPSGAAAVVRTQPEGGSGPQFASAGEGAETTAVDEVIVTAQKKEERIQDVPIAISAFSAQALDEQKIEGGFDLVKAVPNVTFSKNNYSGYNFSIRGVGTKSISATSDPGVAVSFNNVALLRNRLFEQEYFDIERVEVLRGPQGTLYGRNATAGVVNIITARPEFDVFEGSVKAEVGNYDSRRLVGMVNVPIIEDRLAVRAAGAWTQREGYGYNTATDSPVDGRDLWSTRLSVGFEPTSRLSINATWEHFEEDDDRLRTGKQLCHRDPGATTFPGVVGPIAPLLGARVSQGCKQGSLYDDGAYQAPNGLSIPFIAAGQLIGASGMSAPMYFPDGTANPAAAYVFFLQRDVDPYNVSQSRDLRTISSTLPAVYQAKADIFALDVSFDLTDSLTFTSQTLYNEDQVYSVQDYHRFALQPTLQSSSGAFTTNWFCSDPLYPPACDAPSELAAFIPGGIFTDPQLGPSDAVMGMEISSSESKQFSQEFRLVSSFDGPLNFSAGANYMKFEGLNDYYLFFNIVTMLAQGFYNESPNMGECLAHPSSCMTVDPNPIGSLSGDGHNYFRNHNPYELESTALFGEVYWDVTDALKITAGLRYTDDRKTFTPWRSQLLVRDTTYGPGDPINQDWQEFTGRLGFDWKPELSFTDETMIYGFYSRGYKGGGANPPPAQPIDQSFVVAEVPATFEPEFVDAFEVGVKNTLLDGRLLLNGSAFYYNYTGYQVSKVYDRTIVNENFDAEVWGAELEAVWRPTPDLRVNATLGLLETRIGDGEKSIDIFNRTQGREGWTVVTPWIQQTSNCIVPTEVAAQALNMGFNELAPAFSPIILTCMIWTGNNPYGLPLDPADHPDANKGAGFFADLSGNELPNAPHVTFNIGAQYTFRFDGGWEATLRGDYYRQGESYARVYNLESDRLRGWDNANLSLTIERPADDLTFQLYVKNVFDDTPITDAFLNSDSTGMTTNVFTLDPRLIGVSVTKGF